MRNRYRIHLEGDPFEFCHACNYKTRWQYVQEKLNVLEPIKRLDILRKNQLRGMLRRAMEMLSAYTIGLRV